MNRLRDLAVDGALLALPLGAVAVLRAGLTEVFVTGMLMRWMRVSPKPMARPANPPRARL